MSPEKGISEQLEAQERQKNSLAAKDHRLHMVEVLKTALYNRVISASSLAEAIWTAGLEKEEGFKDKDLEEMINDVREAIAALEKMNGPYNIDLKKPFRW